MLEFIENHIYLDYAIRLIISLLCGLVLGIERKMRQHTVGIRTLSLISISCALLSILSEYQAGYSIVTGDPTRITAGVVTGIGFLGAGTIVNQGLNIRGLTSAAIIFTAAALGVCCGAALYIPALIVLIIALIMLVSVAKIEHKFFPAEKRKIIELTFSCTNVDEQSIRKVLEKNGFVIHDLDINTNLKNDSMTLRFTAKTPDTVDYIAISTQLSEQPNLINFSISK